MTPTVSAIEVTERSPQALLAGAARDKQDRIRLGWYRVTRQRSREQAPYFIRIAIVAGPFLTRAEALA